MPKTIKTEVYTYEELLKLAEKHKGTDEGKSWSRAAEKARDWLGEANTDFEWWEYTYDLWKEALDQIGFENANISFRGFASQGDGASFTSSVNMRKLLNFLANPPQGKDCVEADKDGKEIFGPYIVHHVKGVNGNQRYNRLIKLVEAGQLSAKVIRTDNHYSHENTCDFRLEDQPDTFRRSYPKCDYPLTESLLTSLEETAEELRKDICKAIYRQLEEEYFFKSTDENELKEFAEANEYTFTDTGKRFG